MNGIVPKSSLMGSLKLTELHRTNPEMNENHMTAIYVLVLFILVDEKVKIRQFLFDNRVMTSSHEKAKLSFTLSRICLI